LTTYLDYATLYQKPVVQDYLRQFIPNLKNDGLVREFGLFIRTDSPSQADYSQKAKKVIRNCVYYKVTNFWELLKEPNNKPFSLLVSLDCFNYQLTSGRTLPFRSFGTLTSECYQEMRATTDFLIDLDKFELNEENRRKALVLWEKLESAYKKVYVKTSGRGLHYYIPAGRDGRMTPETNLKTAESLKTEIGIPELDLNIYKPKQIFRLLTNEKYDSFCWGLTKKDLEGDALKYEDLTIDNALTWNDEEFKKRLWQI
jgi:hypothetical protein